MAKKLKTIGDIDIFVHKLLDANIEQPINVSIEIELSKKEFDKIVPASISNRKYGKIFYHNKLLDREGIKVFLIKK